MILVTTAGKVGAEVLRLGKRHGHRSWPSTGTNTIRNKESS
jgi:hypothetical protein